jgi:ribonuclease Z
MFASRFTQGTDSLLSLGSSRTSALALCSAMNLKNITTTDVMHGCMSHALIIGSCSHWKFVYVVRRDQIDVIYSQISHLLFYRYSGDTRPTDKLVEAGQNATVLIHEATMGDDMEEMAEEKWHSTVGQAVDVGRRYAIL